MPRPRCIARITFLAFLLNVLLPFIAVYNPSAEQGLARHVASVFGGKVLICTDAGFKFVSWQELQNGKAPAPHSDYKCPLCYLAANGLKDIHGANAIRWEIDRLPGATGIPDAALNTAFLRLPSSHRTRAPPSSLIG